MLESCLKDVAQVAAWKKARGHTDDLKKDLRKVEEARPVVAEKLTRSRQALVDGEAEENEAQISMGQVPEA